MSNSNEREQLASRLGFLLISAGCAIGLGNVWRFPFITGKYGGAAFVLIYLVFLVILGLPVMITEFAIGRAGRKNIAGALLALEPEGSKWHLYGKLAIVGNLILMMFYTTVAGWMLAYFFYMVKGDLAGLTPDQVGGFFGGMLSIPEHLFLDAAYCSPWIFICSLGLQKGVENVTKVMMSALFVILIVLVFRAVTLPGAGKGIASILSLISVK